MKPAVASLALLIAGCASSGAVVKTDELPPNTNVAAVTTDAVNAFISACVNTTNTPNSAPSVLQSLGFEQRGSRNGRLEYESAVASASVSRDTRGVGFGQCSVTPKGGMFASSVALLNRQIGTASLPVSKLANEEAWRVGNGAIILISRNKGAFTRSQPGVFRN